MLSDGYFLQKSSDGAQNVQTIDQLRVYGDSRTIEKEETGFSWCTMADMDAAPCQCPKSPGTGKAGSGRKSNYLEKGTRHGKTVHRKPGFVFVLPLVVEQNGNQKPEIDLANMPKTVSLEQVTNLMRELKKQDVCDMEVDLAEVMWQEPDAKIWNALAHALETMAECLPAEEEGEEDVNMRGDGRRDESHSEQAPMEDDEQRDGSVPEQEAHSKQDLERVRKALEKFHTNLGHPGVKEMVRVSKHGRASELAIQEARRRHCDVCAEMYNRNFLDRQLLVKCWTSTNLPAWTF